MSDHRVKPAACPRCERILDGALPLDGGRSPRPGDFSICLYCRLLLVYTDDLLLRLPTLEEASEALRGLGVSLAPPDG